MLFVTSERLPSRVRVEQRGDARSVGPRRVPQPASTGGESSGSVSAGEDCLSRGPTLRAAPAVALAQPVAVTASELSEDGEAAAIGHAAARVATQARARGVLGAHEIGRA